MRGLARVLLIDAVADAQASELALMVELDLALLKLEWECATGEEVGAEAQFLRALELFRGCKDIGPWLYGGAANVGWLVHKFAATRDVQLRRLASLDEYIMSWIEEYPDDLDVDLPQGILGLGIYGLSHASPAIARQIAEGVLAVIDRRLEQDPLGAFVRLVNPLRGHAGLAPIGSRDLGVAHGNTGLAAYLSMVVRGGLGLEAEALRLLVPVTRWLLAQSLTGELVFPCSVETRWQNCRSAWCYGDPGGALALKLVASALGEHPLGHQAATRAREAAAAAHARRADAAGIVDTCVCHGAAGLCYFGRRARGLFGGDWDRYIERWYRYTKAARVEGRLSYAQPSGWGNDASFLGGDCGVAMGLLYCAGDREPTWDERLLVRQPTSLRAS